MQRYEHIPFVPLLSALQAQQRLAHLPTLPGTYSPFLRALEIGGPWVADLLRALDSRSRSALAESSKDTLQCLLSEWSDEAALEVWVKGSAAAEPAPRLTALRSAMAQLQARGILPTKLALAQYDTRDMCQDDAWWDRVLPELDWEGLRSLALQFQHIPAALLSSAGLAFPQLTTLRLEPTCTPWCSNTPIGAAQLPPPTALPALRHLTINWAWSDTQFALYQSIAPYMQQLSSICILDDFFTEAPGTEQPVWSLAFSRTNPSSTLTHLDINTGLSLWLARLLSQATPQLQHLTCNEPHWYTHYDEDPEAAGAGTGVCSWTRWGVRLSTLNVKELLLSPLPAKGKLIIEWDKGRRSSRTSGTVHVDLPLSDAVAEKLSRTEFREFQELTVEARDVAPEQQVAALSHALTTLTQSVHPPDTRVELKHFTMSPALATAIAAARAAGWHSLSLYSVTWPADVTLTTQLPPLHSISLHHDTPVDADLVSQLVQHAAQVTDKELTLYSVTMSPALAAALSSAHAAGWHKVSLYSVHWPADVTITTPLPPLCALTLNEQTQISDSLVSQLVQHVPVIECMRLCGRMLALQSPIAGGAQLPVRHIEVYGRVSVGEWVKQATLLGWSVDWTLVEVCICLTEEQVESGEAASIAEQLRSLKVSRVHNYEMPRPEWCSDQDEPRVLQVHIAIAQKLLGWQSVHGWKRYTGIGDVD